jgi:hypothetical protein
MECIKGKMVDITLMLLLLSFLGGGAVCSPFWRKYYKMEFFDNPDYVFLMITC